MIYTRNSGPYTPVEIDNIVNASFQTGTAVFDDETGDVHVATLVCDIPVLSAVLADINITDGTYYLSAIDPTGLAGGWHSWGTGLTYYNSVLYMAGTPKPYYGAKYDLSTGEFSVILDCRTGINEVVYRSSLGMDGNIYFGSQTHAYQYNTSTGVVTDLGVIKSALQGTQYVSSVVCDGTYVYVVVFGDALGGGFSSYLCCFSLADPTSKTWYWDDASSSLGVNRTTDVSHPWNLTKVTSGVTTYYDLEGGAPQLSISRTHATPDGTGIYCEMDHLIAWEMQPEGEIPAFDLGLDFSQLSPIDGIASSRLIYWTPFDSGEPQEIAVDFSETNVLSPSGVWLAMPLVGSDLLMKVNVEYGAMFKFNIETLEYTYQGYPQMNVHSMVSHGSNYWLAGYRSYLEKYEPSNAWSLSFSNFVLSDPGEGTTNPYPTKQRYGGWPYYSVCDYEGKVWSVHTERYDTDGWLTCYDPSDGTSTRLALAGSTEVCRSIGIAKSGTTIVAGGKNNLLWVINADNINDYKTISLAGYPVTAIVANDSPDSDILIVCTDESSSYACISVNIDTEVITDLSLPSGKPFGYSGSGTRRLVRFPKGPDGEYYLFIGNKLYAVDISGNFTELHTFSQYYMINFSGVDLVLNDQSTTSISVIYGMFGGPYSRGDYPSLPADDADLETIYTSGEVTDVATDDDSTYVDQVGDDGIAIHQFKAEVNAPGVQITWNGQSTIDCGDSTVYLQIYNRDTTTWDTIDFDDSTTAGNDFNLQYTITDLDPYWDEDNIISCRVYQEEP